MLRLYYVFKYDMICLFINQFQLLVRKPQFEGVRTIVSFRRFQAFKVYMATINDKDQCNKKRNIPEMTKVIMIDLLFVNI